jgi:hypothetical protein
MSETSEIPEVPTLAAGVLRQVTLDLEQDQCK